MACSRCHRPMWRCGGMGPKHNPLHRRDPHESVRMKPMHLAKRTGGWMTETPTSPGWYWLQHAVFRGQAGIWHELHPMIVELSRNENGPLMISVCGDDGARSVDDLIVGEWIGPLVPLQ